MSRLIGRIATLLAITLIAAPAPALSFVGADTAHAYRQDNQFQKHKRLPTIKASELPSEAIAVLKLIKRGGPFRYRKDGTTFQNREKRLPLRRRGYYKEYTVRTPGRRDRGPRRIVAGASGEYYYTSDHYRSFKLIQE